MVDLFPDRPVELHDLKEVEGEKRELRDMIPEYAVYYALKRESVKRFEKNFVFICPDLFAWVDCPVDLGPCTPPPIPNTEYWTPSRLLVLFGKLGDIIDQVRDDEYERDYWKEHPAAVAKKYLEGQCAKLNYVCVCITGSGRVVALEFDT